mgnify:FL=1
MIASIWIGGKDTYGPNEEEYSFDSIREAILNMRKEGDVILTPVPQADGTIKTRPAVILREMPPYKDFLVCGVSTQLHQRVKDFDEVISPSDPGFFTSS